MSRASSGWLEKLVDDEMNSTSESAVVGVLFLFFFPKVSRIWVREPNGSSRLYEYEPDKASKVRFEVQVQGLLSLLKAQPGN